MKISGMKKIIVLSLALFMVACASRKKTVSTEPQPTLDEAAMMEIESRAITVLEQQCNGCHNRVQSGKAPVFEAGKMEGMSQKVNHAVFEEKYMPPKGRTIPEDDTEILKAWIEANN